MASLHMLDFTDIRSFTRPVVSKSIFYRTLIFGFTKPNDRACERSRTFHEVRGNPCYQNVTKNNDNNNNI